jgi:hypothetical protein
MFSHDVLVELFEPNCSVVALDVAVLLKLKGRRVNAPKLATGDGAMEF